MTTHHDRPATPAATLAALWANLRLVVIDTETVYSQDGPHIIEVAAVICRNARRTSRTWVSRVNPGVEVDEGTHAKHGITDDDLVDEPPFQLVEPELTRRLAGQPDETVVLVGFNIDYDVKVAKRDYDRLGKPFPDLDVLDISKLARKLGVRAGNSLADLLATLGITNVNAHAAASDADATTEAALELLRRAATAGYDDWPALHALAMGRSLRTTNISAATKKNPFADRDTTFEVLLPDTHTARHAEILTDPADLPAWQAELADCARLRCPYAADRVAAAELPPDDVRAGVEQVLAGLLAPEAPDPAAVATVLGALAPLLTTLRDRPAAVRWHDHWAPHLAKVTRCGRDQMPCPDCRDNNPCALDTWHTALAPAARGGVTDQSRKSFLHIQGQKLGRGVFTTWMAADRRRLAEETAWLVFCEHKAAGQHTTAEMFARYVHRAGGREPRLVAAYATLLAAPGNLEALQRAIEVCDDAFAYRSGSTHDGWSELAAKRGQLLGQRSRRQVQTTGELDADGNPIPVRRHHPEQPRRIRGRRFVVPSGPDGLAPDRPAVAHLDQHSRTRPTTEDPTR